MSKRGFHVVGRVRRPPPEEGVTTTAGEKAPRTKMMPSSIPEKKRQPTLGPRPPAQYAHATASAYVITAVNRFGNAGGMALLARRLGSGWAPFTEVLETMRLGKALWGHASSRGIKEINWTLKECVPAALVAAPPESMRAATKADIDECMSCVRELALTSSVSRGAQPPPILMQELEQLELGIAMKRFRCPSLERRLGGLMHICSLVTLAEQREREAFNAGGALPTILLDSDKTAWVTAGTMERWLVEIRFLEELFGSSMHMELAKRSQPILAFLAKRNAVSTAHLNLLWSSTVGKHEAVVRVMCSVVVDLVPFLSPHKRLHLFSCLAQTPFYKYTEQTLDLVYQFTVTALQAHRTVKAPTGKSGQDDSSAAAHTSGSSTLHNLAQGGARTTPEEPATVAGGKGFRRGQVLHCREREWMGYGYSLLWHFVQDAHEQEADGIDSRSPTVTRSPQKFRLGEGSSSTKTLSGAHGHRGGGGSGTVSPKLTSLAARYLVSLLKEPEVAHELWPLITRCMDNLLARRSVPSSLEVLRRAISTLPAHEAKSWFGASRSKENSVPGALETLQKTQKLLPALLEEIESYHTGVASHYGIKLRSLTAGTSTSSRLPTDGTAESGRATEIDRLDAGGEKCDPAANDGSAAAMMAAAAGPPNGSPKWSAGLTEQVHTRLNHGRVRVKDLMTRYTHLQHVQARLDFLMFVVTNSSLCLSEAHVDLIWRILVEEALTPEAADLALIWLRKACATVGDAIVPPQQAGDGPGSASPARAQESMVDLSSGSSRVASVGLIGTLPALSEAVLTHLFENKLAKVFFDGFGIRPEVAVLFRLLFIHINCRSKAIRPEVKTSGAGGASGVESAFALGEAGGNWVRHGMELEGLDTLWEIVLDATGSQASRAAAALLVELHHRLGPKLKGKAAKIGAGFVDTCLNHLRASMSSMAKLRATSPSWPKDSTRNGHGSGHESLEEKGPSNEAKGLDVEGRIDGPPRFGRSRSSSLQPPSERRHKMGRSRAASVESRDPERAGELESDSGGPGHARDAAIESFRRRVGRCILLLASFVGKGKEEEHNVAAGAEAVVRVGVPTGSHCLPVLEIRLPGSTTLGSLRYEVARHFRVPPEYLELVREVKRKGNTVAEKLDQDGTSLEAVGLVAPRPPPAPPAVMAAIGTPATASATVLSDFAVPRGTSSSVEIMARLVGEVAVGRQSADKALKKEISDRGFGTVSAAATSGAAAAGTASAAPAVVATGTGGGGGSATADTSKVATKPAGLPDLIAVDDLVDGWVEDETPSRWPSLTMPSEHPGTVTVLCPERRRVRNSHHSSTGEVALLSACDAATVARVQNATTTGGLNEMTAGPEAVGESLPRRRSFRRPSSSSLSMALNSVQKPVPRTQSTSSFPSLPSRIGRLTSRTTTMEEQPPAPAAAATVAEAGTIGNDAEGAGTSPSHSPPPSRSALGSPGDASAARAIGGRKLSSAGAATAVSLESLLPDGPELLAPSPLPLVPPLPHKAEMLLLVGPASSSASSHGDAGGGGGGGGGGAGNALTSLPSLSSLLASAQSVRGVGVSGGGSTGDSANMGSSGKFVMTEPPAAAEAVGEPQHMDQLFNLLEVDLGKGWAASEEATTNGRGRPRAKVQAVTGGWPWGVGAESGETRLDVRRWRSSRLGSKEEHGAVGDVDVNSSLWHIIQTLPLDPTVVRDLRSLRKVESGWNTLLDPRRCYRFVYSLQVVDAFCTARINLSGPKAVESVLGWSLRFCKLGGLEHLVSAFKIVRNMVTTAEGVGGFSSGSTAGCSTLEARTLSAALLSRVLHHLLQFNMTYFRSCAPDERWSPAVLFHRSRDSQPPSAAAPPVQNSNSQPEKERGFSLPKLPGSTASNNNPKDGAKIPDVDLPSPPPTFTVELEPVVGRLLSDAVDLLLSLLRQNAPAKPLVSAVSHVLSLVMGLAGGVTEGMLALEQHPALGSLLRTVCLRVPNPVIRRAACAVFYRAAHWQGLGRDSSALPPLTAKAAAVTGEELAEEDKRGDLARVLFSSLQADVGRVVHPPFAPASRSMSATGGECARTMPAIDVPRLHLVEVTSLVAGLVHVMLQRQPQRQDGGASRVGPKTSGECVAVTATRVHPVLGDATHPPQLISQFEQRGCDDSTTCLTPSALGASAVVDEQGTKGVANGPYSLNGQAAASGNTVSAAGEAAEWLLKEASRRLVAHEFTETFK